MIINSGTGQKHLYISNYFPSKYTGHRWYYYRSARAELTLRPTYMRKYTGSYHNPPWVQNIACIMNGNFVWSSENTNLTYIIWLSHWMYGISTNERSRVYNIWEFKFPNGFFPIILHSTNLGWFRHYFLPLSHHTQFISCKAWHIFFFPFWKIRSLGIWRTINSRWKKTTQNLPTEMYACRIVEKTKAADKSVGAKSIDLQCGAIHLVIIVMKSCLSQRTR